MCWVMPPFSLLGDAGAADRVEQRGFPVVDVPHDRDHGGAVHEDAGVDVRREPFLLEGDLLHEDAEFLRHVAGAVEVEELVHGVHPLLRHHPLDDVVHLHADLVGKVLHRDPLADEDRRRGRGRCGSRFGARRGRRRGRRGSGAGGGRGRRLAAGGGGCGGSPVGGRRLRRGAGGRRAGGGGLARGLGGLRGVRRRSGLRPLGGMVLRRPSRPPSWARERPSWPLRPFSGRGA